MGKRVVINGVIKHAKIYKIAGMQKETPIRSTENPIIFNAILKLGAIYVTLILARVFDRKLNKNRFIENNSESFITS